MSIIKKKPILWLFLILGSFSLGASCAHLSQTYFTEDSRFLRFADTLFKDEVTGNTLNLHYTLAEPEEYGIHNYPLTLGSLSAESVQKQADQATLLSEKLDSFSYQELSPENKILYDTLSLTLETESKADDFLLLHEPLSPALGIQAQLPVLLAEYTFRCEQDIRDYLALVQKILPYFKEILSYEQKKSKSGLFMNAETAQGIIDQCTDFLSNQDQHYLTTIFDEKIHACDFLSDKEKNSYQKKHQEALQTSCFPAYQLLIEGLTELQDTGTNDYGLAHFEHGKEYYCYLVESTAGIYDSIETLESRLYNQLYYDYMQMQRLLTAYPDIVNSANSALTQLSNFENPEDILQDLQTQMQYEFPALQETGYQVKYVDDALKEHLSPAFYLTPPVDTCSPNAIYLNPESDLTGISLYTTLAHEGFPGHMYQTLFFSNTQSHPLFSLLSCGGYVEGWATYIESYAYRYAPVPYEISQYLFHNRSFHLCLYSVLDIGIHYHGWTPDRASQLLEAIGITDPVTQKNIYQILLEDPANYLKYCAGSIYLQDLRDSTAEIQGKEFDLLSYHKKILEIGPVPFPVLKKYLYLES